MFVCRRLLSFVMQVYCNKMSGENHRVFTESIANCLNFWPGELDNESRRDYRISLIGDTNFEFAALYLVNSSKESSGHNYH